MVGCLFLFMVLTFFWTTPVSYTFVDPSLVTTQDVMGGVDQYQNYTGASAFLGSENELALVPRILIAPHFTHQKANAVTANPVTAALLSVAKAIKAVIYEDGPNTVDEDAIQMRQDWGEDRIMIVDNWPKTLGPDGADRIVPFSIYAAGLQAQEDNNVGFWSSASNRTIAGITGTSRQVDFRLSDPNCRANYLNSNQVTTIVRKDGFRMWGNRSTSIDPKMAFFNARRTADMIEESIAMATLWAVDRNIDKLFFEEILEQVGAYIRHLQQVGAVYGGSAWIDRALNTDDVIADGHLYINYDFTVPKIAEHITFVAQVTDKYISNIFTDIQLALTNTTIINVEPLIGTGT